MALVRQLEAFIKKSSAGEEAPAAGGQRAAPKGPNPTHPSIHQS